MQDSDPQPTEHKPAIPLTVVSQAHRALYLVSWSGGCPCRNSKQSPEEAVQRMEELELAASVASRRAGTAEGELHRVKQQLELADKRAKELAWQVCTGCGQCRLSNDMPL